MAMAVLRTSGSRDTGLADPKRGRGRPPGAINKKTQELRDMVERVCGNPLQGMAAIATGDVVKLGYMTKKELMEPPTFDARGRVIRMSGMERALMYIPPDLRAKMYMELAQYLYPKRRALVVEDEDGNAVGGAVIYLPANGRETAPETEGNE